MPAGTVSSGEGLVVVAEAGMKFVMGGIGVEVEPGAPGEGTNGFTGLLVVGLVLPGIGSRGREGNGGRVGTALGAGTIGGTALVVGAAALGFITTFVFPSTAT